VTTVDDLDIDTRREGVTKDEVWHQPRASRVAVLAFEEQSAEVGEIEAQWRVPFGSSEQSFRSRGGADEGVTGINSCELLH